MTTGLGHSRLWATLAEGIITEIFWPSTGHPQTRDLGFLVAGPGWWREVRQAGGSRFAGTPTGTGEGAGPP